MSAVHPNPASLFHMQSLRPDKGEVLSEAKRWGEGKRRGGRKAFTDLVACSRPHPPALRAGYFPLSGEDLSLVAQADVQAAGGADQRSGRVDDVRHADDLIERHVDHVAIPPGHHAIEAALRHQIDRMHTER